MLYFGANRVPARTLAIRVAAWLLLGMGFLCGSKAYANCGDYLWIRDANGNLIRASWLMSEHGLENNLRSLHHAGDDSEGQRPCRGPACGGVPVSLPVPLTMPLFGGSTVRDGLALISLEHILTCNSRSFQPTTSIVAELFRPQDIFEPPRLAC